MHAVSTHIVHGAGELLESRVVVRPAGFLEQVDGLGAVSYTHLSTLRPKTGSEVLFKTTRMDFPEWRKRCYWLPPHPARLPDHWPE